MLKASKVKLDRKIAPIIQQIPDLRLPQTVPYRLDNGLVVHVLDFPEQEVLKIDIVYRAGRYEETKRVTSRATAALLREGSMQRSGAEVAEFFDFYGAGFTSPFSLDMTTFSLFGLRKYAAQTIPMFAEVLRAPAYPEHELETFKQTNIQELFVELEKIEVKAYRHLTEQLFGVDHPYGYNSMPIDYQALTRDDLVEFWQQYHRLENCQMFAAGRVDEGVLVLLNEQFGQVPLDQTFQRTEKKWPAVPMPQPTGLQALTHKGSLQSAIKIGRHLFGRQHPDYYGLVVLNTVLGGYFGSRLMAHIRERKGYTYNIYSTIDSLLQDGYWYISTEVNRAKKKATLQAIDLEMSRLREELIPPDELDMVRNYLLGLLLTSLDGPLNTADVVRMIQVEQIGHEGFAQQIHTIQNITPEQLQDLARRYLRMEDFLVVTVG
jgi:zinc protease